jgi:hypothetical protein
MRSAAFAIVCSLLVAATLPAKRISGGVLLLASEPIAFDSNQTPHFSANQILHSAEATRAGLVKWAATQRGRQLIAYFTSGEYRITVSEEAVEDGVGSAPQPGLATLAAANNPAALKSYDLVLNPQPFSIPKGMVPLPGQPATAADVMAVAWAAEMLHIYFYSRGISLPHHQRDDFQDEWRVIAAELGFPTITHDDAEEPRPVRRRPLRAIGRH